jgi:hypothetical protein
MPLLQIKALPQKDPSKISQALKETCVAIARAYGCEESNVWATWEEIQPGFYVEGRQGADLQLPNSHPPIAELHCFEGKKNAKEIEELLLVASKTLSQALGMTDNIFISYRELRSGQVISGNGVVRRS